LEETKERNEDNLDNKKSDLKNLEYPENSSNIQIVEKDIDHRYTQKGPKRDAINKAIFREFRNSFR
jgi:hypothetical protein